MPEIVEWGEWRIAWLSQENLQAVIALLRTKRIDGVGVSPHKGFSGSDISILKSLPPIQGVVLPHAHGYDVNVLRELDDLLFITIAGNRQPFDCGAFPRLRDLRLEWHSAILLPPAGYPLRSLYLRKYAPKAKSLDELPEFPQLNSLELTEANLTNLSGVGRYTALQNTEFSYLTNLTRVHELSTVPIVFAHFDHCRKISDLPTLARTLTLRVLRYNHCAPLPTLSFLKEARNLEEFRFVGTDVIDGNMLPLATLDRVGFLPKRTFSHSPTQIDEIIAGKKK